MRRRPRAKHSRPDDDYIESFHRTKPASKFRSNPISSAPMPHHSSRRTPHTPNTLSSQSHFLSHHDAVKLRVANSKSFTPQYPEASCVAVPSSPQSLPPRQQRARSPATRWQPNKLQPQRPTRKLSRSQNFSPKAKTNSSVPTSTPATAQPEQASP